MRTDINKRIMLMGCLLVFLQLPYALHAQGQEKISLSVEEASMEEVFDLIHEQTGLEFIYNVQSLRAAQPVTLSIQGVSLKEVLKLALKDTPLDFAVKHRAVVIRLKEAAEAGGLMDLLASKVDEIRVTGSVQDPEGVPIPSVAIVQKGSHAGVSTDLDGRFTLTVPRGGTLVFSSLGFKKQEVQVMEAGAIHVVLEEQVAELGEVIITSSYGKGRLKEEVVGSISVVAPKEIATEQPVVTFDELLEGQAAGVHIAVNPQLGGAVAIDIRGQGTLTTLNGVPSGTSTQPLIIVDGIIMSEETGLQGNDLFDFGTDALSENLLNPLAKINARDIKDISILKDAAAVGIYGADAANGVIIINTKSGSGRLKFEASLQGGVNSAFNHTEYLNGEQYQQVLNAFYTNSGEGNNVQAWDGTDTDWFDLLNRNGKFMRYNLSASGSVKKLGLRASMAYQKTDEPQRRNNFEKINGSLRLNYGRGRFDFSLSVLPSYVVKNNPNKLYAYSLPPTLALYDDEGNYTYIANYGNPVAVSRQNKSEASTWALPTSLNLNYELAEGLRLSSLFGTDLSFKTEDRWLSGLNGSGNLTTGSIGRRLIRERETKNWNWNTRLAYTLDFKANHHFDAIAGLELQRERTDFSYAKGDDFVDYAEIQPVNLAQNQDYHSDYAISTARSFFSQANYNFGGRYFALINFRVDQNSVFGGDNKTALNGGLGVSWNISNEAFFESFTWLDFLRVRTSYGRTGNSRIGTYAAMGLYNVSNRGYNDVDYATVDQRNPPNANLGWEVNKKFNVGLDFNFLGRFTLATDFFRDKMEDMIANRDVIAESGYVSAAVNGAEMYNQGVEVAVGVQWIDGEHFSWHSSVNFTHIQNKVTALMGLESDYSDQAAIARAQKIGYATSTIWGYEFVGVDPTTGRELFRVNDEIYDGATVREQFDQMDWKPIGDSQPDFFGGFRNTFSYRRIRLNVICAYSYGADFLLRRSLMDGYNDMVFRNPVSDVYHDAWYGQGDIATLPIVTKNNPSVSNSSKYIYDASHIKLKSVSLGYSFAVDKLSLPVEALDISLNGANLFYWFKEKSPPRGNGVAELRNTYPEMRTYSLTINTRF